MCVCFFNVHIKFHTHTANLFPQRKIKFISISNCEFTIVLLYGLKQRSYWRSTLNQNIWKNIIFAIFGQITILMDRATFVLMTNIHISNFTFIPTIHCCLYCHACISIQVCEFAPFCLIKNNTNILTVKSTPPFTPTLLPPSRAKSILIGPLPNCNFF